MVREDDPPGKLCDIRVVSRVLFGKFRLLGCPGNKADAVGSRSDREDARCVLRTWAVDSLKQPDGGALRRRRCTRAGSSTYAQAANIAILGANDTESSVNARFRGGTK